MADLTSEFRVDSIGFYTLHKMVFDLESAGLILIENSKITVTDHWRRIQGTLGISLHRCMRGLNRGYFPLRPYSVFQMPRESLRMCSC